MRAIFVGRDKVTGRIIGTATPEERFWKFVNKKPGGCWDSDPALTCRTYDVRDVDDFAAAVDRMPDPEMRP